MVLEWYIWGPKKKFSVLSEPTKNELTITYTKIINNSALIGNQGHKASLFYRALIHKPFKLVFTNFSPNSYFSSLTFNLSPFTFDFVLDSLFLIRLR